MSEMLGIIFLFFVLATLAAIIVRIFMHLYQIFEEPNIQKRMRKLRKPVQPWVTVLVCAGGNESNVAVSLGSLRKSYYHHYDIVVAKDSSLKALKAAYQKSHRGEVVITMKAGAEVLPSFIKRAVATKERRTQVRLAVRNSTSITSLGGIVVSLRNVLWQRAHNVWVSDSKHIHGVENQPQLYGVDIAVFVAIILVSILTHETIIFWYSWLVATSYLCAIIWLDEETIRTKVRLTFSAFSALFLLPVASVVALFSQGFSRN